MRNSKKLTYLIAFFIITSCATSKSYAPKETSTTPRNGFLKNEKISLVFFDSRNEKQNSKEIKMAIKRHLARSYPSANINLQDNSKYFLDSQTGIIIIKINIAGYNAGFGTESTSGIGSVNGKTFVFNGVADGKWNGITGISVNLYDNRNSQSKKYTKRISNVVTKPNTGGYSTARKALQQSFQNVMNNLDSFIDQSLMN
jgi:uncharacterized lipoprotein YajG